jgi:hypothetical protein
MQVVYLNQLKVDENDKSAWELVDESWRLNANESCNSHQLSWTHILVWSGLNKAVTMTIDED